MTSTGKTVDAIAMKGKKAVRGKTKSKPPLTASRRKINNIAL